MSHRGGGPAAAGRDAESLPFGSAGGVRADVLSGGVRRGSAGDGERCRGRFGPVDLRGLGVLLAVVLVVTGCARVHSVADRAEDAQNVASACAEALGLADLNPLVDPARVKARAADKERRLRELADHVTDKDVKSALLTMADSYVEVQRERFDDLDVVANWAKRNARDVDALRVACT